MPDPAGGGCDGEGGNATVRQDATANGTDMLDGGPGVDTADYASRAAPVSVTLDTSAKRRCRQ